MYKLKKAFTLAEVLITLLIIGFIASLTIPGIISNTNEAEYNAGIKKVYSDLSNALALIQANRNGRVAVGNGSYPPDTWKAFRNDFCNVMSCIKADTGPAVFGNTVYKYYKNTSGDKLYQATNIDSSAILNNGILLYFSSLDNCTYFGVNACGSIDVDINGPKGPNMWGKDTYLFYVTHQSENGTYEVIPAGISGDGSSCSATNSTFNTSVGCTAQRLTDPSSMP